MPFYNHNKRITKKLKSNFELFLSTTESPLILKRSLSTPSLIRDWSCIDCNLQNYTVAWHCLNCESVSFLAPIYKGTLFKKKLNSSIDNNDSSCQSIKDDDNDNDKNTNCDVNLGDERKQIEENRGRVSCLSKVKIRSLSMDSGVNHLKKCQLCLVDPNEFLNDCKHSPSSPTSSSSSSSKIICLPLINQKPLKHHPNKLSFDEDSMSAAQGENFYQKNLYYSNRKINKSLSSIADQNLGQVVGMSSSHYGVSDSSGVSVFGERVITSSLSRPNSFVLSSNLDNYNLRRSLRSSTHNDIANTIYEQRHLINSNSEFSKLNNINRNRSVSNKNCTILCDVCGICNKNECSNAVLLSSSSNNANSRFTVTTISRNDSLSSKIKNLTLPKNGGVFVAVKDWFAQSTPIASATVGSQPTHAASQPMTPSEKTYYASIRGHATTAQKDNLNNFHTYENQPISQKTTEEPIYAIVNKSNKVKSKQDTKYSYIGMSNEVANGTSNAILNLKTSASEPLYASIGRMNSLDAATPTIAKNLKASHITSTNCVNSIDGGSSTPSDSSTIYTEVWKGPTRKSSQKS